TAQACGVERCSIYVYRDGKLRPAMSQFADGMVVTELWNAFRAGNPVAIDDVTACARAFGAGVPTVVDGALIVDLVPAETVESFKTRSVVMVPLLRGDRPVGMMLLDDTPARISRVSLPLAELIGRQLTLVIDHDRVITVLRDHLAERNRLVKV